MKFSSHIPQGTFQSPKKLRKALTNAGFTFSRLGRVWKHSKSNEQVRIGNYIGYWSNEKEYIAYQV